jgi:PAS domain S-box-containing protein
MTLGSCTAELQVNAASSVTAPTISTEHLETLRVIAEQSRVALCVRDRGGRFVLVNARYGDVVARDVHALVGRTPADVFDPAEALLMEAEDRQVLAADLPVVAEVARLVAGEPRQFLVVKYPLLNSRRAVDGVVVIMTDVTDRDRGAAPEAIDEAHFQLAFEQAPIGMGLIGLDLRFLRVNQAFCRISGYSAATLQQHSFFHFTSPDDSTGEMHAVLRLISAEREEIAFEKRLVCADEAHVWVCVHLRLVRSAAAEPLYYLCFVEDISAEKRAVADLEHRERLQAALAACSQCLIGSATTAAEERRALEQALACLCEGLPMLRVNVWENYTHPDDGFSTRLFARAASSPDNLIGVYGGAWSSFPWAHYPESYVARLAAGEAIGGPIEQVYGEYPHLIPQIRAAGVNSTQAFPITVHGCWWGVLLFNDSAARIWDEQEVLLNRTVAEIIGAFLQRNRDAAALREREAMLDALSDNIPEAWIYQLEEAPDGTARRTYLSRGIERRSGVSIEQALNDPEQLPIVMHPDDRPGYEAARRAAREAVAPFEYEHRYFAADGSVRWLRARTSPRRLADGRVLWDGIAIDTTSYRKLQEELRVANFGLSRRVDELSLLNRVAHLLSGVGSLGEALDIVARLLLEAFNAAEVLIALREYPSAEPRVIASAVAELDASAPGSFPREAAAGSASADTIRFETIGATPYAVLTLPLRGQGETIGALQIRVNQAEQQFAPDTVSLAQTVAGAIASAATNAQLYAQAVRNSERLERLNAASRMINSAGLNLPDLYRAIHRAVAHLMPVEAFVISLIEKDSPLVEHVYNVDRSGVWGVGRARVETSFAGFMQRYGSALRVDDFAAFQHPDIQFEVYGDQEDTHSGVAASFLTADGLYGLLFAQCYPPGAYTDGDLIILELLAAHAATAIENARRAQEARREAIDAERNRLARDLHDSVSQSLFSATLIAERLPVMAQQNEADAREGLQVLNQLVRGALTEMRALLIELRPAALANASLHDALDQLTRALSGRRQVPITVDLEPTPRLPPAVQVAFYRIAQEGLTNVIKHARATAVHVAFHVAPPVDRDADVLWNGTLKLAIRDDGRGFLAEQVGAGQLGLGIMRERASAIGAVLVLDSRPGQGTELTVTWSGSAAKEE